MLNKVVMQKFARLLIGVTAVLTLQFPPSLDWLSPALAGTPNPGPNSSTSTFDTGAYIIDVGALSSGTTKQTANQGLKPYGLVFELVKNKIPVQWIINPNKEAISQTAGNAGTDFTFDCTGAGSKNYKSGAFVITAEYARQAKSIVDSWKSANSGLVVDGPCTNPLVNLPVYSTIKSWPRVALDAQNGAVAVTYFKNAGIPEVFGSGALTGGTSSATNPPTYRFVAPSALTACDDVYVMPHADPTYATHSNLINFVKAGGDFYASCHAVSVVENMTNGVDNTKKVMNFLSTNGLINYDAHSAQGSPAYAIYDTNTATTALVEANTYDSNYVNGVSDVKTTGLTAQYTLPAIKAGDPIAQFLGITDAAQQQGSEQIYMPAANSRWRATTQIVVYDPTQANTNTTTGATSLESGKISYGPATSVAYGPAFGNTAYGQVMYVGGHSSAKGTVDDVAAQRLFFNFLLLSATNSNGNAPSDSDRTPTVTLDPLNITTVQPGQTVDLNGTAVGGSGTFRYQWSADCRKADGSQVTISSSYFSGGGTTGSTSFTAPSAVTEISNCNLTLTAIDNCGRFTFGYQTLAIAPKADIRTTITAATSGSAGIDFSAVIAVKNISANTGENAGNVFMTMQVPAGSNFVSISNPTGGTCSQDAGTITCDIGSLTPGQEVTMTLVLSPVDTGTMTLLASSSTSSVEDNLANNVDSKNVTINLASPTPQISVRKTPTNQLAPNGGTAAFRLEVENTSIGSITFSSFTITDTFTTGGTLTCMEGSSSTPVLSGTGPTITATINTSLAPKGIWTAGCEITGLNISAASATNTFSSVATYTYSGTTSTISSAPVTSTITKGAALKIEKNESGQVSPGNTITYTVVVTNNTGSPQTDVQFGEQYLPAGLTPVPGSASITTTDLGGTSSDINGVVAFDKFANATTSGTTITSGTGWVNAWTKNGDDTANIKITANTDSGVAQKEKNSLGIRISKNKTYSVSRDITLTNNHTNISVVMECSADSTYRKFDVYLGNKKWADNTCSSSRQQILLTATKSEIGNTAATGTYSFKIALQKSTKDSTYYIIFDDIYLVSNLVAQDTLYTNSWGSGSGFDRNTKWVPSSTSNVKAIYVDKDSTGSNSEFNTNSGTAIYWTGGAASANIKRAFTLDTTKYATGKLTFSLYHGAFSAGQGFKVYLGTDSSLGTAIYTDTATAAAVGTNWQNPAKVEITLTPNGSQTLYFEFTGSTKIYVDDVIISASPKGSTSATSILNKSLTEATAAKFPLSNNGVLTLTFQVKIANPFPVVGATGLVNLASVVSATQTTPSYAQQTDPFTLPSISISKTGTSPAVTSGTSVTFTYVVKNTGQNALTGVSLTDPSCSPISGGTSSLAVNASTTFTCTKSVTSDLVGDTATVTVSATDSAGGTPSNTAKYEVLVLNPAITTTPTPATSSIYAGNRVAYTFQVISSNGNTPLKNVAVTSNACVTPTYVSGDDGDLILQTSETWIYNCLTDTLTAGSYTKSVWVNGKDNFTGITVYDTKTATITVVAKPVLTLTKTVSDSVSGLSGTNISVTPNNSITYTETLTVTNGYLSNVKVIDSGCRVSSTPSSGDAGTSGRLEVGETWVYTCTVPSALVASEASTASAYGTDALGNKIYSSSVDNNVEVVAPSLLLTVEPQKQYVLAGANNVIQYSVTNTGTVAFTGFTGSDVNCTTSGALNSASTLAVGGKLTFTCTYPIPTDLTIQFAGTATYGSSSTYTPDTSTAKVFAIDPRMTVIKYVKVLDPTNNTLKSGGDTATAATAEIGDKIVFRYKVTGAAGAGATSVAGMNSILKSSYTDNDCNSATWAEELSGGFNTGDTNQNGYIDPGESWFYTCDGKSSLTSGGASLMASAKSLIGNSKTSNTSKVSKTAIKTISVPLPKVKNGGLIVMPALKVSKTFNANTTTTVESPVTITGISSLDDPNAPAIGTLSGTSSVTLTLPTGSSGGSSGGGSAPVISKITPTITWPTPSNITWPTPLSGTQLNAVAKYNGVQIFGSYVYQYPTGTVLKPGTYTMLVTFNPTDANGYNSVSTTVTIVVLPPVGNIVWNNPQSQVGPYQLTDKELNASCDIPGATLVYDPALGKSHDPGTYTLTVTCQPPAGSEYQPIKKSVTFVVQPKDKPVVQPTPAPSIFTLNPPTNPTAGIISKYSSSIAWTPAVGATGYLVTIDSKKVCEVSATSCKVQQLVGPKSNIKIYSTRGSLKSTPVSPNLNQLKQPVVVEIIYFDTAKYAIRYDSYLKLKALVAKIQSLGYKRIVLSGHTDSASYDNETLSKNRAISTKNALSKLISGYTYDLSYHGATTPLKDNNSPAGMAANRRVEIAVW